LKHAGELRKTVLADLLSVQEIQAVEGGKAFHPEPTEEVWEIGEEKAFTSVPTAEHLKMGYRHRPEVSIGIQEMTREMGMTGEMGISLDEAVGSKTKNTKKQELLL